MFYQYIHKEEGVARPPFNEEAYLKEGGLKDGEDKYDRNQFNQAASDALGGDRSIPDTRHSQYVFGNLSKIVFVFSYKCLVQVIQALTGGSLHPLLVQLSGELSYTLSEADRKFPLT